MFLDPKAIALHSNNQPNNSPNAIAPLSSRGILSQVNTVIVPKKIELELL
ncbi:hypothetical protein [Myxosarcina sp. GI1(2024)]